MNTELIKNQTPEEQELKKKLSEFAEIQNELAQRELDLATLRAELHLFEVRYLRTVGVKLAELDELKAQIAEALARQKPHDQKIQEQAELARTQAQESAEATGSAQDTKEEKFKPSESLKKLYREVAKRLHPDLAVDEKERLQRQKLMAEANRAYEEGDEAKLRSILSEWENSPESVKGEGIATELIRVIRKIAQAKKRLHAIEIEFAKLEESDLYKMKVKTEKAEDEGRDLLSELASQLENDMTIAKKRLAEIARGKMQT